MAGGLQPPLSVIATWPKPNHVDPVEHSKAFLILSCVFGILVTFAICARAWIRAGVQHNAKLDDWLMLASLLPTSGLLVSLCLDSEQYGMNRHVWDNSLNDFVVQRKLNMTAELCYCLSSGFVKLSILLFYRRLAPQSISPRYALACKVGIIFVVLHTAIFILLGPLTCHPFAAYWEQVDLPKVLAGYEFHCYDEAADVLSASILSALQDFITTTLPFLLCRKLHVSRRRRWALFAIFATGYLVCLIGVARIYATIRVFYLSYDTPWEAWYAWLLAAIEVYVASICACLPALKSFVEYYLPKSKFDGHRQQQQQLPKRGDVSHSSTVGTGTIHDVAGERRDELTQSVPESMV